MQLFFASKRFLLLRVIVGAAIRHRWRFRPLLANDLIPNPGDTAWLLVVALGADDVDPGLALFDGGLVRAKNMLLILSQTFAIVALVGVTNGLWHRPVLRPPALHAGAGLGRKPARTSIWASCWPRPSCRRYRRDDLLRPQRDASAREALGRRCDLRWGFRHPKKKRPLRGRRAEDALLGGGQRWVIIPSVAAFRDVTAAQQDLQRLGNEAEAYATGWFRRRGGRVFCRRRKPIASKLVAERAARRRVSSRFPPQYKRADDHRQRLISKPWSACWAAQRKSFSTIHRKPAAAA